MMKKLVTGIALGSLLLLGDFAHGSPLTDEQLIDNYYSARYFKRSAAISGFDQKFSVDFEKINFFFHNESNGRACWVGDSKTKMDWSICYDVFSAYNSFLEARTELQKRSITSIGLRNSIEVILK
ncbi:hypothetical protein [Aliikangiella coralliicola]|uniref:Uncharacterized protein n=1 Tax=Aliikangiella coralliicola TaxID=2592383 RepID=A0A545U6F4_9GAMM|nr:hypothetical protein [Aliikangiella coralliicola]TQV85061.1 hypothetical protein FLL46_21985 [Aliikangiella coralliicola]